MPYLLPIKKKIVLLESYLCQTIVVVNGNLELGGGGSSGGTAG